ncbi:MarR family transcriptional regulator [Nonomuraea sp. 3-1Str]|uniref:MarR family winged helix-turn-helix transcriptional regulator n=1 Tax=unclassified Nonomuraea TaxID=2593643 RepID=UPI00285D2393|nr:MarR family transcriptional regulator [Nonomuraea sp. 3-1Str]MDR8411653.1 MarR family transcriptional regulator [Nonomuraea sp. 3-1Str]
MLAKDLRIAVGRLARRIRQLYTNGADDDVSFSELAVLARLDREGALTSARLAALERITAQAIGTILGGLHRRGLVARDPDPEDGRRVISSITGKGQAALVSRDLVITERLAAAVDTLTPEERERLAAALPILAVLADRL